MRPRWYLSFLLASFAIGCARSDGATARETASEGESSFEKVVRPFFAKHCYQCHGGKSEKGDIRLDHFQGDESLNKGLETIEKARDMLAKRTMPPKKQPQPADDEVKPVLAWLQTFIARAEKDAKPDPGKVVIRRLNRAEYNNTVRDLLGVHFQPADDFPPDNSGHGFDNIGGALTISPTLMEKYLAAAEKVARTALYGVEPMQPEKTAHQPFFAADAFSKNKTVKFDYDETGMSLPSALHVVQRFQASGEYKLRATMRGVKPAGSGPIELGFWIDGKLIKELKIDVPQKVKEGRGAGEINGLWAELRVPVTAGEHWLSVTVLRMYEGLPAAYKGPKPAAAEGRATGATDAYFPMYLDVVGPYEQVKGPSDESLKKVFTSGSKKSPRDPALAKPILADLARRAYRRPVTDKEVDDLVKLVSMVQKDGDSFEEGLCLAIQRILISPHFLFRVEKTPALNKAERDIDPISEHELASRLSYFLWSSMPDEELRRCADEQRLRKPEVLEAQVRRMLKDAKSSAFVENFGGQWLLTRALESHTPDRVKYSEFTEYTRMSMKKETDLFFQHIVREDRSILDFIDAPYTFVNQRMAEFYGLPGVKGHDFRKVDLTGSKRGGVLTHASVLTVSSYPNRTSPVLRGKWLLENMLNAPPPPPPPEVPSLDEAQIGKTVSLREQLEKHRSNPNCASCHSRLDPLGFALEGFDAIGRARDKDGKFPIETAGALPDGRAFKDHQDLRNFLKAEAGSFAECLTEKMLTYALGRGLERYDRPAIKTIAQRAARDDYRFSSIVLGIVHSMPFQMQRSQGAKQ